MALFMVMFSMALVNNEVRRAQVSLKETFSSPVLTGGKSIMDAGSSKPAADVKGSDYETVTPPIPRVRAGQHRPGRQVRERGGHEAGAAARGGVPLPAGGRGPPAARGAAQRAARDRRGEARQAGRGQARHRGPHDPPDHRRRALPPRRVGAAGADQAAAGRDHARPRASFPTRSRSTATPTPCRVRAAPSATRASRACAPRRCSSTWSPTASTRSRTTPRARGWGPRRPLDRKHRESAVNRRVELIVVRRFVAPSAPSEALPPLGLPIGANPVADG